MRPKIRLITFDVTGTLMKHRGSVGKQYSRVILKHWGVECNPQLLETAFKTVYHQHVNSSPLFGAKHGISAKDWWASVFCGTLVGCNVVGLGEVKHKRYTGVAAPFLSPNVGGGSGILDKAFNDIHDNYEWDVFPDSREVLKIINEEHKGKRREVVAVGAISNNDDRTPMFLSREGLKGFIDFVITSQQAGCEKPNPKIFLQAVECANALNPAQSPTVDISNLLHVGDSYEKDYVGALECGAQALLLDQHKQFPSEELYDPKRTITKLSSVLDYLGNT